MGTNYISNLFTRLQLLEQFNKIVPSTMEGNTIKSKYEKIFETNKSISMFHNFMIESMNSSDVVLKDIVSNISESININQPYNWSFNLIFESLLHSGNMISESIADEIKYLTIYDESALHEAIYGGALSKCMNVTGLRTLHESITGEVHARALTESNILYNPVSYIECKGGNTYFMIENRVYSDNGEIITENTTPSQNFTTVNNTINSIPYDPETGNFEIDFLPGAVNVTSNGKLFKDKYPYTIEQCKSDIEAILSKKDTTDAIRISESRKFDMLNILLENFDSLVKMDNIHAIYNKISNTTTYLCESSTQSYVINSSGIMLKTNILAESLHKIQELTGVNVKPMFETKLMNESNALNESINLIDANKKQIKEINTIIEQCQTEMKFCTNGSKKYNEFVAIMEDAQSQLHILEKLNESL